MSESLKPFKTIQFCSVQENNKIYTFFVFFPSVKTAYQKITTSVHYTVMYYVDYLFILMIS